MKSAADERRLELERKKQKLAEMRENRRRVEEERKRLLLSPNNSLMINGNATGRQTLSSAEVQEILAEVGIAPEPNVEKPRENGDDTSATMENGASALSQTITSTSPRVISLQLTQPQTVTIAQRDMAIYCKTTQTDDEKFSVGEFSLGSQEFDYDDDMIPSHKHHLDFDDSPTEDLAKLLPGFSFGGRAQEPEKKEIEEETPKLPDISEEEKAQIMTTQSFLQFFDHAAKVMERALVADDADIFTDYCLDLKAKETYTGERMSYSRMFFDPRWTEDREVVAITFSDQHPELMAVAFETNAEKPGEPAGIVAVFNTKFKKESPEFVFHAQSRLTSVAFARFHTNLLMAGCYTGQICMWDNRILTKKTPFNKSPMSTSAHTHPIFSLSVVGSHNAHNLVSISTDGRMCSWNVDNLDQPVDAKELHARTGSRQIPVVCMTFAGGDFNNFVIGAEDGNVYAVSRHGGTTAGQAVEHQLFAGHTGPVSSVCFHRAHGPVDCSHLFISSSCDWTVRLWSIRDPLFSFSFDSHTEFVYDAQWSPVHPAVFCSVDANGNLFLWNLNEDVEGPVARLTLEKDGVPVQGRRATFSSNGQYVVVGDNQGRVLLFELHDNYHNNVKAEEWNKFARVLADLKAAREDAEELLPADSLSSRNSATGLSSLSGATSAVAALTVGSGSPRQNWP